MKDAVLACKLCNDSDRFYNNKIEEINKSIKQWQEYRNVDLFTFAKQAPRLFDAKKATSKGPSCV